MHVTPSRPPQANPRTVLLALTGGPISMQWEAATLPAVLVIWCVRSVFTRRASSYLTGQAAATELPHLAPGRAGSVCKQRLAVS